MKKILALAIIATFFAGCNTVAGFGKDVEKVGSKMESAAKK
jgi:entericidin A